MDDGTYSNVCSTSQPWTLADMVQAIESLTTTVHAGPELAEQLRAADLPPYIRVKSSELMPDGLLFAHGFGGPKIIRVKGED